MEIKKKNIPHIFRNKYLRNSGIGGGYISSSATAGINGRTLIEIIGTDDNTSISDSKVFSSKRVIDEIQDAINNYETEQEKQFADKLMDFIKEHKTEIVELLK